MSEAIPTLTVRRPVQNIGQEHIDALERRLLEDRRNFRIDPETIRNIFAPANQLYTTLIGRSEFIGIQQALGPQRLDEEGVKALEERLEEAFGDHPKEIDTDTWPFQQQHWGPMPQLSIVVAKSPQVMKERYTAQGVVRDFLGEGVPEYRFRRSRRIVPVWLASSQTSQELGLLNQVKLILKEGEIAPEDERPLPDTTVFGEIDTRRSVVSPQG